MGVVMRSTVWFCLTVGLLILIVQTKSLSDSHASTSQGATPISTAVSTQAIAQTPSPNALLPTLTPTPDPITIISGGPEVTNISEILRQLGIPLGILAIIAMFAIFILRSIGKENADTLAKRLNVVSWFFNRID